MLQRLQATGEHSALGTFDATVEDVSLFGVGLQIVNTENDAILLAGDHISHLNIAHDQHHFFEGQGTLRHVTSRDNKLFLGIELATALDIHALYQTDSTLSFSAGLQTIETRLGVDIISTEFKGWVSDVHAYLSWLKAYLDDKEKELVSKDSLERKETLRNYELILFPQVCSRMNEASRVLASFVGRLSPEEHTYYRQYVRTALQEFVLESPLLRRTWQKPLGYAGDYEMMNMIMSDESDAPTLFGRAMDAYAKQENSALAIKNRTYYLADKIYDIISKHKGDRRFRLASVGCGPARELALLLDKHPECGSKIEICLLDQEEHAIRYCEKTLGELAAKYEVKLECVRESVRRLIGARQLGPVLGQCDLIYSSGLFDYLNARSFQTLLQIFYDSIVSGGTLLVGNMHRKSPSRWMMDYYLDWNLMYRGAAELLDYAEALRPKAQSLDIGSEPLGTNLFLEVRR